MITVQINYDLVAPGRNYKPVYDYIKGLSGSYAKPLKSMWLARTNKTVTTVRNELMALVDRNDKIIVIDVTMDSWGSNFSDDHITWMKNNMGFARAAA
jgi:hypothetical protein